MAVELRRSLGAGDFSLQLQILPPPQANAAAIPDQEQGLHVMSGQKLGAVLADGCTLAEADPKSKLSDSLVLAVSWPTLVTLPW